MFPNKRLDTRLKVSIVHKYLSAGLRQEGRQKYNLKSSLSSFRNGQTSTWPGTKLSMMESPISESPPGPSVSSSSERNPQINIESFLTEIFGSLTS